jgi:hypothetical protein
MSRHPITQSRRLEDPEHSRQTSRPSLQDDHRNDFVSAYSQLSDQVSHLSLLTTRNNMKHHDQSHAHQTCGPKHGTAERDIPFLMAQTRLESSTLIYHDTVSSHLRAPANLIQHAQSPRRDGHCTVECWTKTGLPSPCVLFVLLAMTCKEYTWGESMCLKKDHKHVQKSVRDAVRPFPYSLPSPYHRTHKDLTGEKIP